MDYYTENLADFGLREITILRDILDSWVEYGLPDDFYPEQVRPAFNKMSGYVFLVNEVGDTAMLQDGKLSLYHILPESGLEGFLLDLISENDPDKLDEVDVDYILNFLSISLNDDQIPNAWIILRDNS